MTADFTKLCESIGAIKTTTKQFYPRNLKLSENFLKAFSEEYENQRKTFAENNTGKSFQPHSERILKALRFHMRELDEASLQRDKSIVQKMGPKMSSDSELGNIAPKKPSKKFQNLKLRKNNNGP